MVHRWHTTTTLTKCVVVWCCGCCFEYPQQWQQHILTTCVVEWCCGSQHPQHHTTTPHFVEMCCCTVLWVLFRVPTTTHFNKMCCCMVLWVLRHTTPFTLLKCVVVGTRNNTIQQHILTKCVVGTRNNTHNTIQQHTLLKCVVVGTRNNTHNTIQQHTLLKCVVVGTRNNTHNTISSGVPQGTVMGPLLFLLYINDLPQHVTSEVRLFADDCLLYRAVRTPEDHHALPRDLEHIHAWSLTWGMSFNATKCYVMAITNKKQPSSFLYSLGGRVLSKVPSTTYLGVTLREDLQWETHITGITVQSEIQYPTRTRTRTIQQHILLKCVIVGTRSNTIQQHTLLMFLLCVTYDDVCVVSSTHSLHPHHFNNTLC